MYLPQSAGEVVAVREEVQQIQEPAGSPASARVSHQVNKNNWTG